jgi:hypothetical protein
MRIRRTARRRGHAFDVRSRTGRRPVAICGPARRSLAETARTRFALGWPEQFTRRHTEEMFQNPACATGWECLDVTRQPTLERAPRHDDSAQSRIAFTTGERVPRPPELHVERREVVPPSFEDEAAETSRSHGGSSS